MMRSSSGNVGDRQARAAALRDRLAGWEEEAGEELIEEALARFGGYSERNAKLIAMQCPAATDVDGFRAWIGRGRCVRKGERGIAILAPAGSRRAEDGGGGEAGTAGGEETAGDGGTGRTRQFFKVAYVFDISQTDPLPDGKPGQRREGR